MLTLKNQKSQTKQYHKIQQFLQEITFRQENSKLQSQSEFFDIYKSFFSENNISSFEELSQILLKTGSINCSPQWKDNIQIKLLKTDLQSLKMELAYGNFILSINVLNTQLNFDLRGETYIAKGGFGTIFRIQHNQKKFIAKCIDLQKPQNLENSELKDIFKQFFIAKICSCLRIGPQILNPFGYDIVIFKKMAFFCMEQCKFEKQTNFLQIQQQLKKAIRMLHTLQICHCDIKNENILWSSTLKKFVIIDFGLSKFIKQKVGQKSLTSFFGTYAFSSPQMKKLFILKRKGYVDMYYNDLCGLQTTMAKIKSQAFQQQLSRQVSWKQNTQQYNIIEEQLYNKYRKKGTQSSHQHQFNFFKDLVNILFIKFLIFSKRIDQMFNLLQNQEVMILSSIYLLNNQISKCELTNKQIRNIEYMISKLKLKVNLEYYIENNIDKKFNQYQIHLNSEQSKMILFPINFIIQMEKQAFTKLIHTNSLWRERIFVVINPFCGDSTPVSANLNKKLINNINRRKLIQKIYQSISINEQKTQFYPLKVKIVMDFFIKVLKQQSNIELLQKALLLQRYIYDLPGIIDLQKFLLNFYSANQNIRPIKYLLYFLNWQCYSCHCSPCNKLQYLFHVLIVVQNENCGTPKCNKMNTLLQIYIGFVAIVNQFHDKQNIGLIFVKMIEQIDKLQLSQFFIQSQKDFLVIKLKINQLYLNYLNYLKNNVKNLPNFKQKQRQKQKQVYDKYNLQHQKVSKLIENIQQNNKKVIIERSVFPTMKSLFQLKFSSQNTIATSKQITNFIFIIFKNNLNEMRYEYWQILSQMIEQDHLIIYQIIQQCYKFSNLGISQQTLYSYLEFSIQYKMIILKNKKQLQKNQNKGTQNGSELIKIKKCLWFITQIIQRIKKIISPSPQIKFKQQRQFFKDKNSLSLMLLKFQETIQAFCENNYSNFTTNVEIIFKQIQKFNNQLSNMNLTKFYILNLIQLKNCKTDQTYQKLIQYIDYKIFELLQVKNTFMLQKNYRIQFFIYNGQIIIQIVKIYIKMNKLSKIKDIIFQIIVSFQKIPYQKTRNAKMWKHFQQIITIFCKFTNKNQIRHLLIYCTNLQNYKIINNKISVQLIYFLFNLLLKGKQYVDKHVINRIIVLTALVILKMPKIYRQIVLEHYFHIYSKCAKNQNMNKRKLLYCLKKQIKYQHSSNKSFQQLTFIIKNLKNINKTSRKMIILIEQKIEKTKW